MKTIGRDKYGNALKIGDKFKRDHGPWKDKDIFTVKGFVCGGYVEAVEDAFHSSPTSIYKLIEPGKPRKPGKKWIIVAEENGWLAPASTPTEYVSRAQAESVAQIMAEKTGCPMFIFESNMVAEPPQQPKAVLVSL